MTRSLELSGAKGRFEGDSWVKWRARHFGVVQHLTSQITAVDPPRYFQDRMINGAFGTLVHDHHFEEFAGLTTMTDVIEFRSPLGLLGRIVNRLFLRGFLERLIVHRGEELRRAVERERSAELQLGPCRRAASGADRTGHRFREEEQPGRCGRGLAPGHPIRPKGGSLFRRWNHGASRKALLLFEVAKECLRVVPVLPEKLLPMAM